MLGNEGGKVGRNLNTQGFVGQCNEFGYYYYIIDSHWNILSRKVTEFDLLLKVVLGQLVKFE